MQAPNQLTAYSGLSMLSHALTSRFLATNSQVASLRPGNNRIIVRADPKRGDQRRRIFSIAKAALKRWGPWKRPSSPFKPDNREVRYTKHNLWARPGPVEGTLLVGVTDQAKVCLFP